jgi:hypothetical protein
VAICHNHNHFHGDIHMTFKLTLIAEFDGIDNEADACRKLDAFREATLPSIEYGITLYRPAGQTIGQAQPAIKPRVLIAVSGGCAYIAEQGHVETLLVDYDNGDELPAEWQSLTPLGTDIPTGKQEQAAESLPGHTPEEFCEYLTSTLIPDLRESGRDATADDFRTCILLVKKQATIALDLLACCEEAVRLYESYGLVAQPGPANRNLEAGKWINATRAAVAAAKS